MIGAPMIAPLIQMIAQSERLEARRIAAEALKEIGGTASMELARFVRDDVPAEQACRVLRIIETVGEAGISTSFFASLSHPDPLVLAAAFELVKRAPRPVALAILRKAMTYDRMAVVTTALAAAQEMKCAELAPEVSRLLLTLPDEAAVRATLTFLAEYPTPEAVPGLQRIYDQRGRMFGLVKGFSSETRALAVSVASRIKHPEARALVQSAQGERDTIVRKAARSGPQDPTPGAPSIFR